MKLLPALEPFVWSDLTPRNYLRGLMRRVRRAGARTHTEVLRDPAFRHTVERLWFLPLMAGAMLAGIVLAAGELAPLSVRATSGSRHVAGLLLLGMAGVASGYVLAQCGAAAVNHYILTCQQGRKGD